MSLPNAKICPRCGKFVPMQLGVCDHCARLFRTPIEGTPAENRTIMCDQLSFLPVLPSHPAVRSPAPRTTRTLPTAHFLTTWLHTHLTVLRRFHWSKGPWPQKFHE